MNSVVVTTQGFFYFIYHLNKVSLLSCQLYNLIPRLSTRTQTSRKSGVEASAINCA